MVFEEEGEMEWFRVEREVVFVEVAKEGEDY